jgi:NAD+ kinase
MSTMLTIQNRLVALYVDVSREHARAIAGRIAKQFRTRGFGVALCRGQYDVLQIENDGATPEESSLLITVGGDGTLLRAARLAVEGDVPVLGINTGRLGFLTELDADDPAIDALPDAVERGLYIEERTALEAQYEARRYFALNDVVVRKGEVSRIVPFGLRFDDEATVQIPADGICVATPTGSTAYFLSAGGSIIAPSVDGFGVAPLLPHTLFSRPLIVPMSSRIEITCDSEIAQAHLECDGDVLADVEPGSSVFVRRYPKCVRLARTSPLRFFERLEAKMLWGVSIKGPRR